MLARFLFVVPALDFVARHAPGQIPVERHLANIRHLTHGDKNWSSHPARRTIAKNPHETNVFVADWVK